LVSLPQVQWQFYPKNQGHNQRNFAQKFTQKPAGGLSRLIPIKSNNNPIWLQTQVIELSLSAKYVTVVGTGPCACLYLGDHKDRPYYGKF
jgi:hypothetical protein